MSGSGESLVVLVGKYRRICKIDVNLAESVGIAGYGWKMIVKNGMELNEGFAPPLNVVFQNSRQIKRRKL